MIYIKIVQRCKGLYGNIICMLQIGLDSTTTQLQQSV